MRETHNPEPVEILLVEDNPADARLAVEALKDSKVRNNLHHVEDGVEAMRFVRRQQEFAHVPRPDLILLDLNLPRKDGREVLAEIKADPSLRTIPVVILTTSRAEQDADRFLQHAGHAPGSFTTVSQKSSMPRITPMN